MVVGLLHEGFDLVDAFAFRIGRESRHPVRGQLIDACARGIDEGVSLRPSVDGARIGVGLRHYIARELEARVVDAELAEEGGREVGLIAKTRHLSCVAHGTSCPNEGDVVFSGVELIDVGRPRNAVIGEDDDQRVLPFGRTTELVHELPE